MCIYLQNSLKDAYIDIDIKDIYCQSLISFAHFDLFQNLNYNLQGPFCKKDHIIFVSVFISFCYLLHLDTSLYLYHIYYKEKEL